MGVPALASAALYTDSFESDTSAGYNINSSSADTRATFGYNYAADSIPASRPGGTTFGLKLEANMALPTGTEAITVSPKGQSFSGNYKVLFDLWMNSNGPFPGGGTGSTQYATAGVGYNNTTVNKTGTGGSGTWFAVAGEGGASATSTAARDFMAFPNSGTFLRGDTDAGVYAATEPSSQDNFNSYYSSFTGQAPPAGQTTAAPTIQTGTTNVGTVAFAWHSVEIDVIDGQVTWFIDGLKIATVNAAARSIPTSGNVSIGYDDPFASVAGPNSTTADPRFTFGMIDNLTVDVIPEPASVSLVGLGALGLAAGRRRVR
jgi:hypothetical protein